MTKSVYIKNMVCDRCIKVVREELNGLPLSVEEVKLGKATISFANKDEDFIEQKISTELKQNGFELLSDPEEQLTEEIKTLLVQRVHELPETNNQKLSVYLASKLNRDYAGLSKLFSKRQDLTIERCFIKLKIERVKELIQNGSCNFSEISDLMNYSSLNHLSAQFKKHTGQKLSEFEKNPDEGRKGWDEII